MRAFAILAVAMFVPVAALAQDEAPKEKDTQSIEGAIITRPEGAYIRYDYRHPLGHGLHAGGFSSFLIYSNEFGASIGYTTNPEFLNVELELAAEPGFYIMIPKAGNPAGATPPVGRDFGWREVGRAQANLNLRVDRYWLYSRSTFETHFRSFHEYDEFRKIEVDPQEYSFEQATAPLVRVNSSTSPAFWLYAEYTVGAEIGVGTLPHRVSIGMITEDFLAKKLSLDLDLFYSFAKSGPGPGAGGILAWWYTW